jgi:endonuclease/exonuclease/phosphatase family metal-dependent hydrolase
MTAARAPAKTGTNTVRVLSLNIQAGAATKNYSHYLTGAHQHLYSGAGKRDNLQKIADLARQYDVVALQEVDSGSMRSGFVDQGQLIASAAGMDNISAQTNRRIGNARVGSVTGSLAQSGNVVMSKPHCVQTISWQLPGRGRGALLVHFADFSILNLHLSLTPRIQALQLNFLAEQVVHLPQRLIVAGDFNCTPESAAMQAFLQRTQMQVCESGASYPSWAPKRKIDLLLHSKALRCVRASVLAEMASDHLPVAAEFLY